MLTDPVLSPVEARLAVLGHPIAHSRSPQIHRAAYAALGLPWQYTAVRVDVPGLAGFLASRGPEWRGFSVTMPLKEEAFRLAAVRDPLAEDSGVVNTLLRVLGGREPRWAGFNTDVPGLARALTTNGLDVTRTVVLGAGATAISALLAARQLGAERVVVLARRASAANELAERFDGTVAASGRPTLRVSAGRLDDDRVATEAQATAVISTLPGPAGADLDLATSLTSVPLFDVAYDPWPSPLARRWQALGTQAFAGLDMLVEQALVQVRIFTQGDPALPVTDEARVLAEMRAAGVGR